MIVIPALELRDGTCVHFVGGAYEREGIRQGDPVSVARLWADLGFRRLHVIDVDAVTGRGTNTDVVTEILHDSALDTQVGGGIRDTDRIESLLRDGARRVVVGTRAIEEMDWLGRAAAQFPGEIVVAADVRERRVVTRGWSRIMPLDVLDAVDELAAFPLAAILVTAVHREGQLRGADLQLMEDVAEAAHVPVIASGGVTSLADVRNLEDRGVSAVVLGRALSGGMIDPRVAAEEFGE